ncbi:hypothetical protein [Microbacterium sp.]|uniref:hypothetical protein n=1 Tax=Microbacterium sp. TaxID=51671 RepID=UPI002FE122F0
MNTITEIANLIASSTRKFTITEQTDSKITFTGGADIYTFETEGSDRIGFTRLSEDEPGTGHRNVESTALTREAAIQQVKVYCGVAKSAFQLARERQRAARGGTSWHF